MPVITISRQYGNGGDEIAEIISKKISYHLVINTGKPSIENAAGLIVYLIQQFEKIPESV